jgi:hypothetical protein
MVRSYTVRGDEEPKRIKERIQMFESAAQEPADEPWDTDITPDEVRTGRITMLTIEDFEPHASEFEITPDGTAHIPSPRLLFVGGRSLPLDDDAWVALVGEHGDPEQHDWAGRYWDPDYWKSTRRGRVAALRYDEVSGRIHVTLIRTN